jgi:hypothetical protein
MTPVGPTQPLTAGRFLFGAEESVDSIAQALDQDGGLGSVGTALQRVPPAGRQAAVREVAAATKGLLDLDLGSQIIAGWRKHAELAAAAERTLASPGTAEVVELATHHITSVHRLAVDLLVNDVHAATIQFELRITFTVQALVVTVRNGRVASLHSGACDITATLTCEDLQLATRRDRIELPLLIRWPLRVRPSRDTPAAGGGKHLSAPSPSLWPRPLTTRRVRRRRQLRQARRSPPAD